MNIITGGCQCGDIRFEVSGEPDRVGICHCMNCRKHHGAVFYAAAIFMKEEVTVTGNTGNYEGRHFCPHCGSSVFAESGGEIELHLGSFDEPNQFAPDYELWTKRRESWLPDFTCIRRYEEDRK